MRLPRIRTLVAVAMTAILAYGMSAYAAPQENRPFEGWIRGTTTAAAPDPSTGLISFTATGNIQATHIGRGTYVIEGTEDFPRHEEAEEEHMPGGCGFVNGTVTITAANGDQLVGDLDGDRSVICVSDQQGRPTAGDVYYSTLFTDVTGGTGRFEDATGWLFSEGTSTLLSVGEQQESETEDEATVYGDIDY